ILIAVVDGRQKHWSMGYTLASFAQFFIDRGAVWAMNMDGGGSSAMVVNGEVKNRPSDGHERAVGSSLLVLLGAPQAPVPYTGPSHAAAGQAALHDPGSTGGLLAALADGAFGPDTPS